MNKYIKILLYCILFAVIGGFVSCESYLDKTEASDINPDDAFKNFYNFQGFTEELYHCIPDFAKQQYNNSFNWGEEEHYSLNGVNQGILISKLDLGNFWAWQKEFSPNDTWMDRAEWATNYTPGKTNGDVRWQKALWPLAWYGIAKANLGIANLDKLTDATDAEKKAIAGQLYFFRGWFHFQLIQYFGGLPYIDHVIDVTRKVELPRESYKACADKAALDFQKAVELLPMDWSTITTGVGNELRVNKIMALAYLGKNYLWAGSPLMNKVTTGSEDYNSEYCQKAADAFGELLALVESGQTKYKLLDFADYSKNWMTTSGSMPGSTEAIFRGPNWGNTYWSVNHQYLAANVLYGRSWSFYPTANYANYFGMSNGLPINQFKEGEGHLSNVADAKSGYDPSFPWKNRDPRFYITYGFDTQQMIYGTLTTEQSEWRYANLYSYDIADKASTYRDPQAGSTTGYLLNKYNFTKYNYPNGVAGFNYNRYDAQWKSHLIHIPWVRLADVYLMYAEALAIGYNNFRDETAGGCLLTAVQAVNKVRARAGVADVHDDYLNDLAGFMSELRRERAVELAFEGHRFNDLRRWLLLTKAPYTLKKRIEFTRNSKTRFNKTDPTVNKVLNLREEIILERRFDDKHYWLPLKKNDTYMYLNFYQNPGW